ncbi:hypothetical protein QUF80_02525 [Desulfococcaceae bacterium HSG8]|nr:hypothetical protein [Desulfococcaceae bacterium HSG8]
MSSILTLEEAAEYLKLKPEELSQELCLNRLPGIRIAGQWRLKREALDMLFEKPGYNKDGPVSEIKEKTAKEGYFEIITAQPENVSVKKSTLPEKEIPISNQKESEIKKESAPVKEKIHEAIIPTPGDTSIKNSEKIIFSSSQEKSEAAESAYEQKNSGSPDTTKVSALKTICPPGSDSAFSTCLRGRIFAYNPGRRFGHSRLADGRVVWINASDFLNKNYIPQIGDILEFNMNITPKGFQAYNIIFISHDGHITGEIAVKNEVPDASYNKPLSRYLGMRDLYSHNLPVSGPGFFGRKRLLTLLTNEIHSGQFLGIYGLRKMGKTSLLYQFRDEKLREEAVAYVDLQSSSSLSSGNCNPLYWELERDLYLRLRECEQEITNLLRLGKFERFSELPAEKEQHSGLIFSEDIRSILDALATRKISSVKRLVIVLDELERILPIGGQPGIEGSLNFFGLLRGLAQTERYRGLLSGIVVAANASISERGYWEGIENPVFALYKPLFLPCFTLEECNEMIVTLGKNMSVCWADDALKTIFAETGGHPFLTRIFCSKIVKQYPARPITVSVEMVKEQIIPFIRTESDKLQQITELLHTHFPQEEKFLNQIALDETPKDIPDEALRHLLGYNLIQSDGKKCYHITIKLLRRWLRRRAGERD